MARRALIRWLPRQPALRWTVFGVGGVLVALVLLFALIQTPPGKWAVARIASSLASNNGLTVEISELGGFVPWNMRAGKVVLSDPRGQFAQANDVQLDWHPLRMLSNELAIDNLQAASIDFQRRPELPPSPRQAKDDSSSLPHMLINRLAIGRINLGESVLGTPAEVSLHATVDSASDLTNVVFEAQRHDAPGSIKGVARFAPGGKTLDLDIAADEPAGGLVVRLLNVEGAPAFHAALKGQGSLDAWDGSLTVTAGPDVRIDGNAAIRAVGGYHRATLSLNGDLQKMLPANIAPLFAGTTQIDGSAAVGDDAVVSIDSFTAAAAGFGLQLGGTFDTRAFIADLTFILNAADARHYAGLLPGGGSFASLRATGTLSGAPETPRINARITGTDIAALGYRVGAIDTDLKTVPDNNKGLSFTLDGKAQGLGAGDPAIAAALNGEVHLSAAGSYNAQRQIELTQLALNGNSAELAFNGHATPQGTAGKLTIARLDLAIVSPFVHRRLGGQLVLDANIDSAGDFSRFAVDLDGHVDNFSSDIAQIEGLLAPSVKLSGKLSRSEGGALIADNVKASSNTFEATLDGQLDRAVANLKAHASFADLSQLDPRLSGAATASATFSGSMGKLNLQAALDVPKGKAMDRDIEGLSLRIDANDVTGAVSGDVKLDGSLGGKPATGSATIATAPDGARRLDHLDLAIGSVTAKGGLAQTQDGKIAGELVVKAGNLNDLAPLTLTEMAGQIDATIKFDIAKDIQRIVIDGTANGMRVPGITLGSARAKLTVLDPTGAPAIAGTAELANLRSGSTAIDKATFSATDSGNGTDLRFNANALGATIDGSGKLSAREGGVSVLNLTALRIVKEGATATLAGPATITMEKGLTRIDRFALNTNGGGVTVNGTAGNVLNLKIDLRALPLSLLALAAPDIDATGTVSGSATVTGSAAAPSGNYDLTVTRANTTALARSGIGPFDARARGTLGGGRVTVDGTINAPSLKGITVAGSVPMGQGALDLTIRGQGGLNLINTTLATSGAYTSGNVVIDATVKGTTAAPLASGTMRISDGRFNDAINGTSFEKIDAVIVANGRQVTIQSFNARTAGDGTVQAQGNVTLDPQAGFPGNIQITMQKARLLSNETIRLVADAKLALSGAFATTPTLAGTIDVRSMDVNIAEKLPGSLNATEVRHINVPGGQQAVAQTPQVKVQQRKKLQTQAKVAAAPLVATLDLNISAPNNVFVRGRGIEAEFGGNLKVTGTSANPITNGGFDIRRGRFDVLDRRLNFSRGRITFRGSTDPELDIAADSQTAALTATVHITGPASAPKISFSSTPALPEDEVLAQLLFSKNAGSLSPGQAIQVARAIQQFTGNGSSRMDDVRRSLGISSLDIGTGENGTGQVGIGKRINESLYLGVSQGTTSNSGQVSVDVDVMKNIKLQGRAGAAGAEIGIGAEWDY